MVLYNSGIGRESMDMGPFQASSPIFDTDQEIDLTELSGPEPIEVTELRLVLEDMLDRIPPEDAFDTASIARAIATDLGLLLRRAYSEGLKDGSASPIPSTSESSE